MNIGENIRKRRLELNMSQQQLAHILGYKTRSSIAKIEKGDSDISHSKLVTFANVLNTTVESLLNGRFPESSNKNLVIPSRISTDALSSNKTNTSISAHTETIVAVILAGGTSSRNQQNTPNQFVNVNGKPVIIYTLEAYQKHPAIDSIYVVSLSGWANIITAYAHQYNITKLMGIIPAGDTGSLSVKASVEWLASSLSYDDIVVYQEATRPMVTEEMISNIIQCTQEHGSAITFEPMDEHIQFMQNNALGVKYVDRSKLISIQSPEAYHFRKLHRAFLEAKKAQHIFDETCCAMLMYNLGKKLVFCEGNRYNIKIVRQEDLKIFESLLQKK